MFTLKTLFLKTETVSFFFGTDRITNVFKNIVDDKCISKIV